MPESEQRQAMEAAKRTPPAGTSGFVDTSAGRLMRLNYERGVEAGWKAGVEWAEQHGESSMVKWFTDQQRAPRGEQSR